jgi:hypothetical protein
MINLTKDGGGLKLGLNLYRAPGGFVVAWAWYDLTEHEATIYRFRLRLHIKPRILWETKRFSVIDHYLHLHDLIIVGREELADLYRAEAQEIERMDAIAHIKP